MTARAGLLSAFAVAALLAAVGAGADAPLRVQEPWVRSPPPNATVAAGYLVLENPSDRAVAVVGGRSPAFAEVMIHRTQIEGGIATMTRVHRLEIAPRSRRVLAPGRYHLMLMKPQRPLRAGEEVVVTLELDDGQQLAVRFRVRAEGPAEHGAHGHH